MAQDKAYQAEPVREGGALKDIRFVLSGPHGRERSLRLWGRDGLAREQTLAASLPPGHLPVLLGSGLGHGLEALLEQGPVAVVDAETPVQELTGLRERFQDADLLWLDRDDPVENLAALRAWQAEQGGAPLHALKMGAYLRLNPELYAALARTLDRDPLPPDFQARTRYPKFASAKPRVLLFRSDYFLMGEICAALDRLGLERAELPVALSGRVPEGFVEKLLSLVVAFKPDMALTVNHLGLDSQGRLAGVLEELGLPLASWFVDSPELILYRYPNQNTPGLAVFSFDADALEPLAAMGFSTLFHLPLATDIQRFHLMDPDPAWAAPVSFVGNSLVSQVNAYFQGAGLARADQGELAAAVAGFRAWPGRSVAEYLRGSYPGLADLLQGLDLEGGLSLEQYVTFAATRDYRADCLRGLKGLDPLAHPLIAGDPGWAELLGPDHDSGGWWRALGRLDYARDLPRFYASAQVNFNATSLQMKGAVNQRVFDVPACGGFLLTDARSQLADLFEPGREMAVYQGSEDAGEQAARWLRDASACKAMVARARARVLAEHTYEHRVRTLLDRMRRSFV